MKMKDLFKVSDTAEIMFTLQTPVPSLVSSSDDLPCPLAVARDESNDVSSDDSCDDREYMHRLLFDMMMKGSR